MLKLEWCREIFKIIYLSLPVLCGLSLVAEWGLLSSCGAWAPHCGCFSCGAQALERTGFSSFSFQSLEHRLSSCGAWA